jgi:hypothetical protein
MESIKYINLEFGGDSGLCNKLLRLVAGCDFASGKLLPVCDNIYDASLGPRPHEKPDGEKYVILDPEFYDTWGTRMLCEFKDHTTYPLMFSEIYDMEYFNEFMKPYNVEMVLRNSKIEADINVSHKDTWTAAERMVKKQRLTSEIKNYSMLTEVARALVPNKINKSIIDHFAREFSVEDTMAFQHRIESDNKQRDAAGIKRPYEKCYRSIEEVIEMYKKSEIGIENIFYTCGERHLEPQEKWEEAGYNSCYFYDSSFGYDLNAAINLELCSRAKAFAACSRSTFTSWITLKRSLLNKGNSYVYNLGYSNKEDENGLLHNKEDKLYERKDMGVYPHSLEAVEKEVLLV